MEKIFLIEKGWIDPMENDKAMGYTLHSYTNTEDEAKTFCESKGYWTEDDCWEVCYIVGRKMPKYRYKEINLLNEK